MRHLCDRVVRQVATHRLKTTALKGHSQCILTTDWISESDVERMEGACGVNICYGCHFHTGQGHHAAPVAFLLPAF